MNDDDMNDQEPTPDHANQITPDLLEQYVRCYTVPNDEQIAHRRRTRHPKWAKQHEARRGTPRLAHTRRAAAFTQPLSAEGRAIQDIGAPYEGWCLVFDCETTTDTRQALRFGVYAVHGLDADTRMRLARAGTLTREALDRLHEAGIFYDPDFLSAEEIVLIQDYAQEHELACWTRDAFVQLLYFWLLRRDALVIGHNLPFDLSRLAHSCGPASGRYRGGFTLSLCRCPHAPHCFDHPPIRIKLLARHKARIAWQKVKPLAAKGHTGSTRRITTRRPLAGKFLDTATLGRALLGPGDLSLRALGERAKASVLKWPARPDLEGPLNQTQLDYASHDVAATWSLYQAERALYRQHSLSTPPWQIRSEASLGKAYLRELGVPPFLRQHPEVPPQVHGYGMVGCSGGRSEVRIRLQLAEVVYCDFKSQYPSVNALMALQDLLLAKTVTVRDATAEVRALLATFTYDQLQDPACWRRLRVLVKVRPAGDLLPVRAEYGPDGRNLADAFVTGPPVWYALADVLAGVLRTGRVPAVLEAIELVPSAERISTRTWKLFGDDRYVIDLARQDFFTAVINLRTAIQVDQQQAAQEGRLADAAYLDGLQLALKLLANSTSYGILIEVNAEERTREPQPITVYSWRTKQTTTHVLERPGEYFAGAVGALIPAGGRLLLALAEQLAAERGMGYAHCDTDGMTLARPEGMDRATFRQHVAAVREWFTPLSPYRGQPPLFEEEQENRWQGELEPLYFLGVSTKRYALYNRLPDGSYRLRKFSSHGVGTWTSRAGYVSPPHIPAPCAPVHQLGGERWQYDLWYEAIRAIDGGTLPDGQPVPRNARGVPQYTVPDSAWLSAPAFHQVTISTWKLYETYRDVPGIRPFSFITVLPPLTQPDVFWRCRRLEQAATEGRITWEEARDIQACCESLAGVSLYAPYATQAADLRDVRRGDTHALVTGVAHRTLAESLRDYFRHPEWKSGDPHGMGLLPRRLVQVLRHLAGGKESNAIALMTAEETDGVIGGEEAGMDGAQVFDVGDLRDLLQRYSVAELARVTGLPRRTLYELRSRATRTSSPEALATIKRGIAKLESALFGGV